MIKPSLPKGVRDFGPQEYYRRELIFSIIRKAFQKYGFQPIETPAFEYIETLTEKYGEEGDKLLFRILNSGDFLQKVDEKSLQSKDSRSVARQVSEKGLRYDLTVPLARFVSQHRNDLNFPFKRYQIQPVWRADKPQKGRYREFYQCDADVIGSESLIYDAELILIFDEVFRELGISSLNIRLNNRKVLYGIAEHLGLEKKFTDLTVAIDKLDKIGIDGVVKELQRREFPGEAISYILKLLTRNRNDLNKNYNSVEFIGEAEQMLQNSASAKKGLEELRQVFDFLNGIDLYSTLSFDLTLARGLDYYTGTIFEVGTDAVKIGSIASGGRYDELTATFGFNGMGGVGISFGADRIYDVMQELELFVDSEATRPQVLLINFGGEEEKFAFSLLHRLREQGISAELYHQSQKIAKQFKYADKIGIPFVMTVGAEERQSGNYGLKNLQTGEQQSFTFEEIVKQLS